MADMNFKCTFDKAQYFPGEDVVISLPDGAAAEDVSVTRLEAGADAGISCSGGEVRLSGFTPGGYGVKILSAEGEAWEGAFEIAGSAPAAVRYGFLADFGPGDVDTEDVEWMRDLHINAVQFYDWMYRHDRLIPPGRRYSDPMGREMDAEAVRRKIERCRQLGMRPMAYGAVYAATPETAEAHPDWCMYTMSGRPMKFADWLYFMNVAAGSGWTEHLMAEYRDAIAYGFSGIHMDTYGFPKRVWDSAGNPVELKNEFPGLINRAAREVRGADASAGVIFNAVNNWPIDTVAASEQDAAYIEVWPPNDRYSDLYRLIRRARELSGGNVVLAAYLKPFRDGGAAAESCFRLCWAAISASGGTQLVLGERMGLLSDSYYVDYTRLSGGFSDVVQKYCDFLVRYGELLYNDDGTDVTCTASGGINEDICFSSGSCAFSTDGAADTVWTVIRESEKRTSINLVNLTNNSALWNEGKREPERLTDIRIRLRLDRPAAGAYMASPDAAGLGAEELKCSFIESPEGRIYTLELPELRYWALIWIQLE